MMEVGEMEMTEEEMIRLALEMSAEEERQRLGDEGLVMDQKYTDGPLLQINTLNQHHTTFLDLITRYQSPSSICGMTSIAIAHMIIDYLAGPQAQPPKSWTEKIEALEMLTKDKDAMMPQVVRAMAFIHDQRLAYIQAHEGDFPNEVERERYMKAWVANFEISDYFREEVKSGGEGGGGGKPYPFFVRYNQWPARCHATHEEFVRLAEEERFGGKLMYHPERKLLTALDWMADRSAQGPAEMVKRQGYAVLVTDTNGHFVTTLVIPSERRAVVFNTMSANVLSSPIFGLVKTLFLGEVDH